MFPSEVKIKSNYGYRYNVFEGWKKLLEAAIYGDGYTVEFYRLSERTIDRNCDALNGWYNIWTKFLCEYSDSKGRLSITVRKSEDADRLFRMLSDIEPVEFEHEGIIPGCEVARTRMETLIEYIER